MSSSAAQFAELGVPDLLVQTLAEKEIDTPSAVQRAVIPVVNDNRDALVCAETGSGKTLAYLLPILTRLADDSALLAATSPYALIIVPTRELAIQVQKELEWLAARSGIQSALLTGGQEVRFQSALLRRNPEIVVGTPGRLAEHISRKSLVLDNTGCLVLDEADRMLDMGFRDDVLAIASHIQGGHQTLLLSATLKHKGIGAIAGDLLDNPETLQLSSAREVNPNVELEMILADDPAHKLRLLTWLLANRPFGKSLVFANTRVGVESVATTLQQHGYDVRYLHGEISQDARRKIMADYREGRFNVLVATDVAARGLDVAGLDLVINVDMAHSGAEFVHRAGRTGRAGESGTLISLVAAHEWNLSAGIQRYLNVGFKRVKVPGLEAKYKGPKKLKASGKAAGTRKKKKPTDKKGAAAKRGKAAGLGSKGRPDRKPRSGTARNKARVGGASSDEGMSPLKRPRKPG